MAGIFISYRRLDSGDAAGRLFDHLARHFGKAQVFMDINGGIERGADFESTLRQALDRCGVLLALIGQHWATCTDEQGRCRLERGDDWVRNEIATAIRRRIPLFPVVFGDACFPPSDSRLPDDISRLAKHQLSRIRNESWDYDIGELISAVKKHVRPLPNVRAAAPPSSGLQQSVTGLAPTKLALVPIKTDFFVGREDVIVDLRTNLAAKHKAALHGLGGIGKTQTAIAFVHRYQEDYQQILWLPADSGFSLHAGFARAAQHLSLPESQELDQAKAANAVKRWLEHASGWLLVLDNADEPELIKSVLASLPSGHVLITSRAKNFFALGIGSGVELPLLSADDAVEFFQECKALSDGDHEEIEATKALAHELGYLPLALEQAAAFIKKNQSRVTDYLKAYKSRRLELLNKCRPIHYPETVLTTWDLNFQAVRYESQKSAALLEFSALLAPDRIPLELAVALTRCGEDPIEQDMLLEPLTRYSLARRDVSSQTYDIHRLVQEVMKEAIKSAKYFNWEIVVDAVNRVFPDIARSISPASDRIFPHALSCQQMIEAENWSSINAGKLILKVAYYLRKRSRYAESKRYFEHAIQVLKKAPGPSQPNVAEIADAQDNLGVLYRNLHQHRKAEAVIQEAIASIAQEDPGSYLLASPLVNLALVYKDEKRFADAEGLLYRALKIVEHAMELTQIAPEVRERLHTLLPWARHGLAEVYYHQKKYSEAGSLCQKVREARESELGSIHPYIAWSHDLLAEIFCAQERYDDAEVHARDAIQIRENAPDVGMEHRHTALSVTILAGILRKRGKYYEAESLLRRAIEINEKVLGPENPGTADSYDALADLLEETHAHDAAGLRERSRKIRSTMPSITHE